MGGNTPMTWAEIYAFALSTAAISEPWEVQTLFDMSRAYAKGLEQGDDPLAIPPYQKA